MNQPQPNDLIAALADAVAARLPQQTPAVQPRLMTIEQAAEYMATTPEALRKRIRLGKCPGARKIGRKWVVDRRRLDEALDAEPDLT